MNLQDLVNKQSAYIVKNQVYAGVSVFIRDLNEEALENLREDVGEAFYDVMEWWFVDESLGERISEFGGTAIPYGMYWLWGRITSGQAIYMDELIQRIAFQSVRMKMEIEANFGKSRNRWEGSDVSIEHSLLGSAVWVPGETETRVFVRVDDDKWNWTNLSSDPKELISQTDWANWDEMLGSLNKPVEELTMHEMVEYLLWNGSHLDVCGEAYEGYMTTDEVLFQLVGKEMS